SAWGRLRALAADLSRALAAPTPSADFMEQVRVRIARETLSARRRSPVQLLAVLAGAGMLLAAGLHVFPGAWNLHPKAGTQMHAGVSPGGGAPSLGWESVPDRRERLPVPRKGSV